MSDNDHGLETLLKDLNDAQWNGTTLRNTLSYLIQRSPSSLCIFIDGLDEYQGPMHELLKTLLNISSEADSGRKFKLCLASRPEPIIAMTLTSYPGLAMHDHNKEAIEQYVSATIKNLHWPPEDELRLLELSWLIAEKAEGIFLWARFALSELIESHAMEESSDDLYRRLDALPASMEDLYANMFSRMKPQARADAQLLFQLVCSSISPFTVRQMKEAEAVSNDRFNDIELEYRDSLLQTYARRLQAKSGGLLECVTNKYCFTGEDSQGPGDKRVKTIHRSVISFIEEREWLNNFKVRGQAFRSSNALWVYICCKYLDQIFRNHSLYLDEDKLLWRVTTPRKLRSSLFEYCQANLFEQARRMEHGCDQLDEQHLRKISHVESAFEYLCLVSDTVWSKLRDCFFIDCASSNVHIGRDVISTVRKSQPWQLMVEHALHLTVERAFSSGKYSVTSHSYDISLVLLRWGERYKFHAREWLYISDLAAAYEPYHQLIVTLIKHGARPEMKDIIICLKLGQRCTLEKLLETRPSGKIEFNRGDLYAPHVFQIKIGREENYTYNGEAVGPLWELARMRWMPHFETILDYFLGRGEDINANCGPRGTMLHALIIRSVENMELGVIRSRDVEYVGADPQPRSFPESFKTLFKILIKRGVDVNVCGTWGTPLQMIWKMLRFCKPRGPRDYGLKNSQAIMILLRDHGANCEWIEPDRRVVTKEDIDTLCLMHPAQLAQQVEPRFRYPGYYTWETLSECDELSDYEH